MKESPTEDQLVDLGKHISFTERRAEDAERELRQVKILELLSKQVGQDFPGVITGITNFGIFVQLTTWLIDGLIRYEDLMDDWWDVDERAGVIRGQRSGRRIRIGDTATVRIVRRRPGPAGTGIGDHSAGESERREKATGPGGAEDEEGASEGAVGASSRRRITAKTQALGQETKIVLQSATS